MTARLPFVLCSAVLLGGIPVDGATGQRNRDRTPAPNLEHLTFSEEEFESEALGRDVPFGIFLPADYGDEKNADKTYPLVIWLHGMWEDHRRFRTRGGGEILDEMTGKGEVPAMIFVCANGGRSSFYINGARPDSAYEDMVRKGLIAHLESNYRVSKERGARAIAGVSMGGYGALKIAMKDPSAFGVVVAHSAAVLPIDHKEVLERFAWLRQGGRGRQFMAAVFGEPVDEKKWSSENVLVLARDSNADRLDGLKIYFDCGEQDRYGFLDFPSSR